ncbi:MAG: hypothetical protein ACI8RZ_002007 [Myxococcota bacterium]|jgi:hypothetical protein
MLPLLLAATAAADFTPPAGWVAQEGRALRDPATPSRGEIREIAADGASGQPQEFALALLEQGLSAAQTTVDDQGRLNIMLTDGRLGRAIWVDGEDRWLMLTVDPAFAGELDPDALLIAALTPSAESVWGVANQAATPLDGGGDGSPWSGNAALGGGSWVDASTVEPWAQDGALLGIWECSMLMADGPTQLKFSFEAGGTVRLERSVSGRTEHATGTWTTRGAQIRMDLPGSEGPEEFQSIGGTLTFRYDHTRLTLYKQ